MSEVKTVTMGNRNMKNKKRQCKQKKRDKD